MRLNTDRQYKELRPILEWSNISEISVIAKLVLVFTIKKRAHFNTL